MKLYKIQSIDPLKSYHWCHWKSPPGRCLRLLGSHSSSSSCSCRCSCTFHFDCTFRYSVPHCIHCIFRYSVEVLTCAGRKVHRRLWWRPPPRWSALHWSRQSSTSCRPACSCHRPCLGGEIRQVKSILIPQSVITYNVHRPFLHSGCWQLEGRRWRHHAGSWSHTGSYPAPANSVK